MTFSTYFIILLVSYIAYYLFNIIKDIYNRGNTSDNASQSEIYSFSEVNQEAEITNVEDLISSIEEEDIANEIEESRIKQESENLSDELEQKAIEAAMEEVAAIEGGVNIDNIDEYMEENSPMLDLLNAAKEEENIFNQLNS